MRGLVVVFLFGIGMAGSAAAQDAAELTARERFERGRDAYEAGRFTAAAHEWEAAYELEPRARILFNLGQVYERLGQIGQALDAYERFIAEADTSDEGAIVTARAQAAVLREQLARTGIQLLGAPDGATIFVDDDDWGQTPRPDPIPVAPGSHHVRLVHPDYGAFEIAAAVPAGQIADVTIAMERTGPSNDHPRSRVPAYALIGSGAGVLAIGGSLSIIARRRVRGAPHSTHPDTDSAKTLALISDILLGVGAATAISGLIYLIIDRRTEESLTNVAPVIGPGLIGVESQVRF